MEAIELSYKIKINMRLGFWIRGWCPKCPFFPADVRRNVEVSTWYKQQH